MSKIKYNRVWEGTKVYHVGAREFVAIDYDEVNIAKIKKAYAEYYGSSIGDNMEVDMLAGEQGPPCHLQLIYILFIQRETSECCESLAGTSATIENDCVLSPNPKEMLRISFQNLINNVFGKSFIFQKVYLGVTDSCEVVTIEHFINGKFTKYISNTGFLCVPEGNVIGQKAETFVHFSYELSIG